MRPCRNSISISARQRLAVVVLALLLGQWALADSPVFVFPHLDADQPWYPVKPTSFGTLTDTSAFDPMEAGVTALSARRWLAPGGAVAGAVSRSDPAALREALEAQTASPGGLSRADTLLALGITLTENGESAESLAPLREFISITRHLHSPFSSTLTAAYIALGTSLQHLGEHRLADEALAQAQGIVLRHQGTRSEWILPVLLARSESWRYRDEPWESEQLLRTYLKLVHHNQTRDSAEAAEATILVGEALTDRGHFRDALTLYRQQLEVLADDNGQDTPLMAGVLTAMARTYLLEGSAEVDRGRTLSVRAAGLLERFPGEFSVDDRVRAQLAAGDWLTLFGQPRLAARYYERAWRLSRQSPDATRWLATLSRPELIFAGPDVTLDMLGLHWAERMAYARFSFIVRPDGKPAKVRLVQSNLHATRYSTARQMMRKARFRPAIVQGRPVPHTYARFDRIYDTRPPQPLGLVRLGLD